jgi:hypothetical protein
VVPRQIAEIVAPRSAHPRARPAEGRRPLRALKAMGFSDARLAKL